MRGTIAIVTLCAAALFAVAATCTVTNESLTSIDGHDTFAGELRNESGVDILQHRFRVAFLNKNGAVVESRTVDGCLRSLQAGASNFFAATSTLPDETTTVALGRMANLAEDPGFEVGDVEDGDIAILDVVVERMGGTLFVQGKITNNDNDTLEDPIVCIVVWNEDDRVVTVHRETGIADLDEDESANFDIEVTVPDDADLVDLVDVWADGLEDGTPVEPAFEEDYEIALTPTATPTATSTGTAVATATATATATPVP